MTRVGVFSRGKGGAEDLRRVVRRFSNVDVTFATKAEPLLIAHQRRSFDVLIFEGSLLITPAGAQAYQTLRRVAPELKILFISDSPAVSGSFAPISQLAVLASSLSASISQLAELSSELRLISRAQLAGENRARSALTHAAAEVLKHVADGLTNKEIADRLKKSQSAVKKQRERGMKKIGAHNAAQVAQLLGRFEERTEINGVS